MLLREEIKNFQKCEYDKYIEKIEECINYYESYYAKNNRYILYLANGERINFKFHDNNIAHMLGVDITYLSGVLQVKGDNAYEILKKFIEDSYGIYNKIKQRNGDMSLLFSQYIDEKLDIFKRNIETLTPQDIYFVSKYDVTRKYQSGEILSYTSDYYLAREYDNESVVLLGIKKEDDFYYPQSSRLIKKDEQNEKLKQLLENQVLTFCNAIKVDNSQNGYVSNLKLNLPTKRSILTDLINLCSKYNCDVVTASDHLYSTKYMITKNEDTTNEKEVLSDLLRNIKNGQPYDLDEEEKINLSSEILEIVDACNDLVIQGGNNVKSEDNKKLYSELQKENLEMIQNMNETNKQNDELKSENSNLLKQLEEYKSEINRLQLFQNTIFEFVDKEKIKIKQ